MGATSDEGRSRRVRLRIGMQDGGSIGMQGFVRATEDIR